MLPSLPNYLFGPPVANGDLKVTCTIAKAYDHIPSNKSFKTGAYQLKAPPPIRLESTNLKLDKLGNKRLIIGGKINYGFAEEKIRAAARLQYNYDPY